MAQNYLAYPDLGRDQFTGIDPDQDPQQFVQLIEKKFRFSHGDVPAQQNAQDDYNFRRKSYSSPRSYEDQLPSGSRQA